MRAESSCDLHENRHEALERLIRSSFPAPLIERIVPGVKALSISASRARSGFLHHSGRFHPWVGHIAGDGEPSPPATHAPPLVHHQTRSPPTPAECTITTPAPASPPVSKGISAPRPSPTRPQKTDPPDRRPPHSGPNPVDSLSVSPSKRTRSFFGPSTPPSSFLYFRPVMGRLTFVQQRDVRLPRPVAGGSSKSGETAWLNLERSGPAGESHCVAGCAVIASRLWPDGWPDCSGHQLAHLSWRGVSFSVGRGRAEGLLFEAVAADQLAE